MDGINATNKNSGINATLDRYGNGGGGTSDYTDLENKPSINGVELSGNKTSKQLDLASPVKVATQMPKTGFVPNIMYELGTLQSDTTFLLAAATDNTIANVWTWTFSTGSTVPMITWPQQVTMWEAGSVPVIKPNTHYEIRVMGGFAICFSTDNSIEESIEKLNTYIGADNLPTFDNATYYSAGSYVKYNGSIWRFTTAHQIGSWTGEDAIETSVLNELQQFVSADKENVYINVSSSDNKLTLEGLQVSVYFEDTHSTQILTCDANGDCNISIDKGKVFTISVPNQSGYYHPASYKLRANVNARYVFFVYETTISGYCNITVNMAKSGGRVDDYPNWNGKTVNLILSDNGGARSATIANGVAVFEDVPKGHDATIYAPTISGWRKPTAAIVNTNFNEVSVTMTYEFITATGIFMVREDGQEFTYETWDTQDTCIALHFATQDLMEAGCDWYMELGMEKRFNVNIWQNGSLTLLPNVPVWSSSQKYYDGKTATANIISDCAAINQSSPQANVAVQKSLTINGNTTYGYLPTRDQLEVFVQNVEYVKSIYNLIGLNDYALLGDEYWFKIYTSSQIDKDSVYVYTPHKNYSTKMSLIRKDNTQMGNMVMPVYTF